MAVLFLSGLLLLSFRKLIAVDLGFTFQNVALFDLIPASPRINGATQGESCSNIFVAFPECKPWVFRSNAPWAETWPLS